MEQHQLDVAGAARFFLDSCGVDGPRVDPFAMARMWGCDIGEGARSDVDHGSITIRRGLSTGMRFDAAHKMGHIIAGHVGMDPRCERTANGIASAVLMPDAAWKRDVRAAEWDLAPVVADYDVSWQVAARRMVETLSCVASVWDWSSGRQALLGRYRSSWLSGRGFSLRRTPRWECSFASECHKWRCHISDAGGGVRAYIDESRVIVVSEIDAWESR